MYPVDLIWSLIGFALTVLIFTYLAGDNFLFRFVIYTFIGVSAAYAVMIVINQVLYPQVILAMQSGSHEVRIASWTGLILGILLCGKLVPGLSKLGNIPMGILVGVGAAVAIGGGIAGTLIPQILSSIDISWLNGLSMNGGFAWAPFLNGVLILAGTITSMIFFHYGARKTKNNKVRRGLIIEGLAWVGKIFIAISLGAIFTGILSASLTALVERISFLINVIRNLLR